MAGFMKAVSLFKPEVSLTYIVKGIFTFKAFFYLQIIKCLQDVDSLVHSRIHKNFLILMSGRGRGGSHEHGEEQRGGELLRGRRDHHQ